MGNGDLGVSMQNNIDTLTFIWKRTSLVAQRRSGQSYGPFSCMPGMAGATYFREGRHRSRGSQRLLVSNGHTIAATKSWVQADDTKQNELVYGAQRTPAPARRTSLSLWRPVPGKLEPGAVGSDGGRAVHRRAPDSGDRSGATNAPRARGDSADRRASTS